MNMLWKDFETECSDYLNEKFGLYAVFTHMGGADSTVSDIRTKTITGKTFYIEAKHSPAQCGQFVLFPCVQKRNFVYSDKNVNASNPYSEKILTYMNAHFDKYCNAGTSGKDIDMPDGEAVFSDWIILTYKEKGVEFFITNGYTILPIDCFKEYFDVSAKYRIKRSGSSSVGKSRLKEVCDYLKLHDYLITEIREDTDKNKLFVKSNAILDNQRFNVQKYEYMFSLRSDEYEIRKLSNTYNANVIFSVTKKEKISGLSDEDFINYLKK